MLQEEKKKKRFSPSAKFTAETQRKLAGDKPLRTGKKRAYYNMKREGHIRWGGEGRKKRRKKR